MDNVDKKKELTSEQFYNKGLKAILNGDLRQGAEYFTKALELDNTHYEIYYNRAHVYDNLEEYDKAILDYNEAMEFYFDHAEAYWHRAHTYDNMEKYSEAIKDFTKAIELGMEDEVYYYRAEVYCKMKEYDKALQDYSEAIAMAEDAGLYYYSRSLVYEKLNQKGLAEKDYQKAIDLGYEAEN